MLIDTIYSLLYRKMSSGTVPSAIPKSAGKRPITELETLGVADLRPLDIGKAVRVSVSYYSRM